MVISLTPRASAAALVRIRPVSARQALSHSSLCSVARLPPTVTSSPDRDSAPSPAANLSEGRQSYFWSKARTSALYSAAMRGATWSSSAEPRAMRGVAGRRPSGLTLRSKPALVRIAVLGRRWSGLIPREWTC